MILQEQKMFKNNLGEIMQFLLDSCMNFHNSWSPLATKKEEI